MLRVRWFAMGAVLGTGLTAVYVTVAGPVPVRGSAGAQVRVLAGPTGALDVLPAGVALSANDLRPGEAASGSLSVRNQTARTVALDVTAPVDASELDHGIVLTIEDDGEDGHDVAPLRETLRGLQEARRTGLVLAPGEIKSLTVITRLPEGAQDYQGVAIDVPLRLEAVPVDA